MTSPALKKKYEEQLGTTLGKARNQLCNQMLLYYATLVNQHICHKCNLPVVDPQELSLDHIKPWRNEINAKELYWDTENVTIAHLKCNKVDRPGRIALPPGMSYCSVHKDFHPVDEFYSGNRWNGLDYVCKEISKAKAAKYENQNPRFKCPECGNQMRKVCQKCGHDIGMAQYMSMRRQEGAQY